MPRRRPRRGRRRAPPPPSPPRRSRLPRGRARPRPSRSRRPPAIGAGAREFSRVPAPRALGRASKNDFSRIRACSMSAIDIAGLVRQIPSQYPFVLVDRVLEHDPATGLVASQERDRVRGLLRRALPRGAGHARGAAHGEPGPGRGDLAAHRGCADPGEVEVHVVGIDDAKFRRPRAAGRPASARGPLPPSAGRALPRFRGEVRVGEQRVAEGASAPAGALGCPRPRWTPPRASTRGRCSRPAFASAPTASWVPRSALGRGTVLDSHVVLDGDTRIGERNHFFPFSSIGLAPQDLKYRGEPSRLEIGDRNTFREFVTVHRGTQGGGGVTRIGSDNLFMTEVHVAHDCQVGSHTIFANAATLAGHVEVQDWATISAFSGVHQFCRVGVHAFVGGFTVVTKDVLPFSKTVGNRGAHLRRQHGRPRPARLHPRKRGRHPRGLPPAPAEPAQHHRGRGPPGGGGAAHPRGADDRGVHPELARGA